MSFQSERQRMQKVKQPHTRTHTFRNQFEIKFIGQHSCWNRTTLYEDILQCCGSAIKLMTYYFNFWNIKSMLEESEIEYDGCHYYWMSDDMTKILRLEALSLHFSSIRHDERRIHFHFSTEIMHMPHIEVVAAADLNWTAINECHEMASSLACPCCRRHRRHRRYCLCFELYIRGPDAYFAHLIADFMIAQSTS